MIFIDGSNFYHAVKAAAGSAHIDFERLSLQLTRAERRLMRVYYYNCPAIQSEMPERYKAEQRFFGYLEKLPYFEVKLGHLARRGEHLIEKGADVKLAVDMVVNAFKGNYDTCILISGDGDFCDAVQAVKDLGKHVEVAYPQGAWGLSGQLRNACDAYTPLDAKPLLV